MYKSEVLNSLKNNPFTIILGNGGSGKTTLVNDIAKDNNFKLYTIRCNMMLIGELDNLKLDITQDTIVLIDDIDKIYLPMEYEINRFIHRIKNINSEFNVYICGTVSDKDINIDNILNDINYNIVKYGINVDDFIEYMGDDLVPEIKDFLKNNPAYFYTYNTTPRKWSYLTIYLKSNKKSNINLIKDISQHFIGDDAKKELINFIEK